MRAEHKKKMRVYWTVTLIPVAAALLFSVLYPLIRGRDYLRRITYPAENAGTAQAEENLTVWFFDVGQADASLVRTPDDKYLLFDAGSDESENFLAACLKDLGVKEIEAMFLSHEHEDHIGGADRIIREFNVKSVIMNRYPADSVPVEKLARAIVDRGMVLSLPDNGEIFSYGDVAVLVMLPIADGEENDASAVYRLAYGNIAILYTGDAEEEAENRLLTDFPLFLQSNILKVGHHGSSTSTTEAFLSAAAPDYAVISCGKANEYGHPDRVVLERLEKAGCSVTRTDLDGTVVFRTDGNLLY